MSKEHSFTSMRKPNRFMVGDRVMTSNCRLGTIVRVDKDELGDYCVVVLDIVSGEYAYDFADLEKI